MIPESATRALAVLLHQAGRLKRLRRQGWIDRGVAEPESVADHSFRVALAAAVIGSLDPDIDAGRAVVLALLHDLPEALAGDVTPFDDALAHPDVDRDTLFRQPPVFDPNAHEAKKRRERAALGEMTANLPSEAAALIHDAWEEYETGVTPEARLVRQIDKLETWFQAREYEAEQPDLVIESFRIGTRSAVEDSSLVSLLDAIDAVDVGSSPSSERSGR